METAGIGRVLIQPATENVFIAKDFIPHLWCECIKSSLRIVCSQVRGSLWLLETARFVLCLVGFFLAKKNIVC